MTRKTAVSERFTLEKFAENPFYQEVNRRLVALAGLRPGLRVVDLGAGTGAVTLMVLEQVASPACDSEVIAVEPSPSALAVARRNVENLGGAVVRFVQGGAERLSSLVRRPVDAVFFCNAIHLVKEKAGVMQEVARTLREGGTFSFNTSFFRGAEPPESIQFYRRWMMKALRALREGYGLQPDRQIRAMARQPLSQEDYVALLEENGFRIRENQVVPVPMTLKGFQDISEYSLFIEGALPGVPLEAGSDALKRGAREAFDELGIETSPRYWLLLVAQKA
ncbi:MAG TPA: methyltransferase domain-containing protein [Dehalococcoidia bacterium]|nr:methyltransferase domain-containing protein [Dehalococcoidia bacterium]